MFKIQFNKYINISNIFFVILILISLWFQQIDINNNRIYDYCIIICLFYLLLTYKKLYVNRKLFLLFSIYFILFYILYTLISVNIELSFIEWFKFIFSILFFLVGYHFSKSMNNKLLIYAICVITICLSFSTILYYYYEDIDFVPKITYVGDNFINSHRRKGFMIDPNFFAFYLISLSYLFIYFYSGYKLKFNYLLIVFILLSYLVLMTLSRTGYIAYGLILVYLFLKIRIRVYYKIIIVILFLIIMIIIFNNYQNEFSIINVLIQRQEVESSAGEARFLIWNGGLQAFFNNPFGYGPGAFREIASFYSNIDADAHNTYLSIAVNSGVMGLIFYCLICFYLFKLLGCKHLIFIFIFIVYSMTLPFDTFRHYYFILGILIGVKKWR